MQPRLLDLFCGAGGAAMGYHRAGFEVVGVDHVKQPRYPFEFIEADALEILSAGRYYSYDWTNLMSGFAGLGHFDVIHASPPCQAYTLAKNIQGRTDHPELIEPTRKLLQETGLPYVIENVPGAPLIRPALVCGLALGLRVKRHRLFESNIFLFGTNCPKGHKADYLIVFGGAVEERGHQIGRTAKNGPIMRRKRLSGESGGLAMGIDWTTDKHELSQAIPPAYTYFIGKQLLNAIS